MVVFLIFKIKKKTNLNYMHDYRIEDDPYNELGNSQSIQ